MTKINFTFLSFVSIFIFSNLAHGSAFQIKPTGVAGSAGAGIFTMQVEGPQTSNFVIDQGTFAALSAERGLGILNLYLNLSLGYMSATGNVNYDYTTIGGTHYTASNAAFRADVFQGGLGLKLKLIDGFWFRPYVEGGGTAGYFTMNYTDISTKVSPTTSSDYKSQDSLLDFGDYAEGGAEISFSDKFGIRVAARFTDSFTKQFDTLAKNSIHYKGSIYYLALLARF